MALVGREGILNQIVETADRLNRGDYVIFPGILLQGPTGYGKTALVNRTVNYCSEKGIPSVTIDFAGDGGVRSSDSLLKEYVERSKVVGEHRYWGEGGKVRLMGDIMGGLMVSADAPAGKPIYENPSKWNTDSAAAALVEYTNWLRGFRRGKPLNINLENIDKQSGNTLNWFNEVVFGPAILGSGTLSVMTSRSGNISPNWSVVRNTDAVEVGPLDKAKSDIHLKTLGWEYPDLAYPSTGGIPGLNVAFAHDEINSAKSAVDMVLERSGIIDSETTLMLPVISLLRGADIFMLEKIAAAAGLQVQSRSELRRIFIHPVLEAGLLKETWYGYTPVKGLDVVLKTSWAEGHSEKQVAVLKAAVDVIRTRKDEGNWKGIDIDLKMAEDALKNS